ncbi:MAG: ferrochelatase [Rhizobiales bacterium]|nr:ferrochelatase [Hyphomicrobiales bacterium]
MDAPAPTETASRHPGSRPAGKGSRVGVLLLNLGTPDSLDTPAVRRYLKEFLWDARVIETPRVLWYLILNGIILRTRPAKTGANYAKIWNREKDESPLRTYARSQAEKLAGALSDLPGIVVEWGMRYGNPSTAAAVESLVKQGCRRIVAFPLYPQYSATTTATANDQLFRVLMEMRDQPAIRTVPDYHDEPAYIDALAVSIRNRLAALDFEPEVVLASFHGIPKSYSAKGDPYYGQCMETSRLLRERLGWSEKRLLTTFQSRFGSEEWLQPYTDKTVERLAQEGVKSIAILNPGFSVDCLETLEEIDGEVREIFLHAGGENFAHIPCLNDSPEGMAVIETVVRRDLQGWA